jgi:UDP-N-acetylglucosamine--N-acetylmuramyl-(pentapeptide) pyrophosphoryl-undecaprenol N-acetylglucosamine transferase
MPEAARQKLIIVQQARAEDEETVRDTYRRLGVDAEVRSFFSDLPVRIAQSHLVIARAGASTVSELAVIGRPAILVPLPHALDQDQAANSRQFAATGAAIVVVQSAFSPQWLATALVEAQGDAASLARRAAAAKRAGIPDAAERLADLVQSLVSDKDKNP